MSKVGEIQMQIAGIIYRNGPMSRESLQLRLLSSMRANIGNNVISSMMKYITPPRTPPEFRPLQSKYIASAAGTRGETARDIYYLSISSRVPAHRLDTE